MLPHAAPTRPDSRASSSFAQLPRPFTAFSHNNKARLALIQYHSRPVATTLPAEFTLCLQKGIALTATLLRFCAYEFRRPAAWRHDITVECINTNLVARLRCVEPDSRLCLWHQPALPPQPARCVTVSPQHAPKLHIVPVYCFNVHPPALKQFYCCCSGCGPLLRILWCRLPRSPFVQYNRPE